MAVLVTGGAGYIGSHFVLELLGRGEEVVVLDDLTTGIIDSVPPQARFVRGDAGDPATVMPILAQHGVDAVVHFAAKVVVPDSVADPLGYYLANTAKTRNLLATLVEAGVRNVVFSSTAAVYGNPAENPVAETAPTAPVSPYGTSKLMSEWMLRDAAAAHGLRYAALRYFNVAGADPEGRTGQSTPRATHLIKVAVETAVGLRPAIEVFGTDYATPDGTCVRDYIHVTDLARAHVAALAYLRAGGAPVTLNCGYGRGHSVREVIDAVGRAAGKPLNVVLGPRRPGDAEAIVAEAERIRGIFGWTPAFNDLDLIVAHALAWERKLGERRRAARA